MTFDEDQLDALRDEALRLHKRFNAAGLKTLEAMEAELKRLKAAAEISEPLAMYMDYSIRLAQLSRDLPNVTILNDADFLQRGAGIKEKIKGALASPRQT